MHPAIEFFHPNVCHVCKKTCRDIPLKKCSQCRLISYCSPKHQKQNWKAHKEICQTVISVLNMEQFKHIKISPIDKFKYSSALVLFCEIVLGRKLDPTELTMIYLQKSCSYCEERENLEDCPSCLSNSLCSKHAFLKSFHDVECEQLQLSLEAHLFKSKTFYYPSYSVRTVIDKNYNDMKSFLRKNVCIHSEITCVSMAMISDLLTRPLTVLYALSILNQSLDEDLVVDIVGSNDFETSTAHHWGLLQNLVSLKNLRLNFIGPEIVTSGLFKQDGMCVHCSQDWYHDYCKSRNDKPAVVVAFNCGLHEFQDAGDTWGPSLAALLSFEVPVVLTSYTASEALQDVARLQALNRSLRVRQICNPYASLSPLRDVESCGVYFVNSILSILTPPSS